MPYPMPVASSLADAQRMMNLLQPMSPENLLRYRQAAQEEADRQVTRSLTPLIYGAQPQVATIAPPITNEPMTVQGTGAEPAAPASPPAAASPSGATVSANTIGSLASAVGGPEKFAAVMRTPEGRAAVRDMNPITPEEFDRRKRRETARTNYLSAVDEMNRYMEQGDAIKARLALVKAYRAASEGADDPTALSQRMDQELERIQGLRKDQQQLTWANEDAQGLHAALRALNANPDDPTATLKYMDALMSVKSKVYQQDALRLLPEIQKKVETQSRERRLMGALGTITKDVNDQLNTASPKGITPDIPRVWQRAFANHPQEASELSVALLFGKVKLPDAVWNAAFPGLAPSIPKSDREVAYNSTVAEGLRPGTPEFSKGLQRNLKDLALGKKETPEERDVNLQLKRGRLEAMQVLNDARREAQAAKRTGAPLKAETINNLTLSMDRLIKSKEDVRVAQGLTRAQRDEQIREIDGMIADIRGLIGQKVKAQKEGRTATPPRPASPAPPPRAAMTPTADPAALRSSVDAAVTRLFPGRTWPALSPQEKQKVVDAMKTAGPK